MWDWISKLEELRQDGRAVAIATVLQCTGSTPRELGAKMLVVETGACFGTIGGGNLEDLAARDAVECLQKNEPRIVRYPLGAKTGQCCGGIMEILFEVVDSGPRVLLFGAGHVGQAVCRTLVGTPFRVHLVDERHEWIESPRLPWEIIRHAVEWHEVVDTFSWDDKKTYVIVMTHRHDADQEILENVLKKSTRYIGLIGSRSKWERFKQRMTAKGFSPADLERVKCPIGISLGGGKAPQEIAVSIAAELLRVHYGA